MHSILIEPVVEVGLEVDMVSEVARPGTSNEEVLFVGDGVILD